MAWRICPNCKGLGRRTRGNSFGMIDFDGVCPNCGGFGGHHVSDGGSGGSGPGFELGPFGKKFLGFGLILLGLWIAPGTGAEIGHWLIPGVFLALGIIGLIRGIAETDAPGWAPFEGVQGLRGVILRGLWLFRPRLWLIAWVAIIAGFIFYGSPHLRIQYGPGGCDYWGVNGWERYGWIGSCPIFKAFPLRF